MCERERKSPNWWCFADRSRRKGRNDPSAQLRSLLSLSLSSRSRAPRAHAPPPRTFKVLVRGLLEGGRVGQVLGRWCCRCRRRRRRHRRSSFGAAVGRLVHGGGRARRRLRGHRRDWLALFAVGGHFDGRKRRKKQVFWGDALSLSLAKSIDASPSIRLPFCFFLPRLKPCWPWRLLGCREQLGLELREQGGGGTEPGKKCSVGETSSRKGRLSRCACRRKKKRECWTEAALNGGEQEEKKKKREEESLSSFLPHLLFLQPAFSLICSNVARQPARRRPRQGRRPRGQGGSQGQGQGRPDRGAEEGEVIETSMGGGGGGGVALIEVFLSRLFRWIQQRSELSDSTWRMLLMCSFHREIESISNGAAAPWRPSRRMHSFRVAAVACRSLARSLARSLPSKRKKKSDLLSLKKKSDFYLSFFKKITGTPRPSPRRSRKRPPRTPRNKTMVSLCRESERER